MYYCKVPSLLAFLAAVYVLACSYYLVMTRNIGTPFKDSLNEKQLQIKKEAATKRSHIFYTGIMVGTIIVLIVNPLFRC